MRAPLAVNSLPRIAPHADGAVRERRRVKRDSTGVAGRVAVDRLLTALLRPG